MFKVLPQLLKEVNHLVHLITKHLSIQLQIILSISMSSGLNGCPLCIMDSNNSLLKVFPNIPCYDRFCHNKAHDDKHKVSRVMRKPDLRLRESKCADQLRSQCVSDQRVYDRFSDSTTPLLT